MIRNKQNDYCATRAPPVLLNGHKGEVDPSVKTKMSRV
jgi:hypothetical protein